MKDYKIYQMIVGGRLQISTCIEWWGRRDFHVSILNPRSPAVCEIHPRFPAFDRSGILLVEFLLNQTRLLPLIDFQYSNTWFFIYSFWRHSQISILYKTLKTFSYSINYSLCGSVKSSSDLFRARLHPRTRIKLKYKKIKLNKKYVIFTDPLDYFSMMKLVRKRALVLTDSGGLQKGAFWSKIPCITLREKTEWS